MTKNYTSDYQHNRSFLRGLLPPKGWLVLVLFMMFSANSYSQSVGIVGDAVGTWTNDVVLSTSDNITYTLSNYTFSGGSAKFRQGGNWTVNWGANAFPSGTGTQGGANIPVVAGTYNVTFNRTTGSYTFTAVSSVPTLAATTAATSITTTTATSGGNVTSDGGAAVTERGIVYATTANPTTGNTKVQSGSGTGSFTSNMTGLSPNTTYYVRAYAINSVGTAYGAQISFTTSAGQEITVSTTSLTAFADTCPSATSSNQTFTVSGTNLTANITVTAPTDFQVSTSSGSGFGTSVTLTQSGGTVSSTTIYARFAPGSAGSKSGNITATSTGATTRNVAVSGVAPAAGTYTYLRTLTATATINQGSNATLEGEGYAAGITNPAGQAAGSIVEFGYNSSNTNPTSDVAWTWATATFDRQNGNNDLFRANSFGSALAPGTYYYTFRFKLTACSAWQYTGTSNDNWSNNSGVLTVTGPAGPPVLAATTAASAITATTATSGGNVTSDGGAAVTERGIVYATTANPTTGNTKVQSGSGTGSFTSNMTGLSPNTTYYVRAYAINSSGTAYGAEISFTTSASASSSVFYADRIYFKNGTASSEKYYAEYNAVPNGGCTGNNSETAGTEAWNGRNLGTYTTGTTAQLGAFIVTKGVQNGNGPIFRYRVYETGSTPPVFLQSNLNYVGECNADGVQVNGSDMDKIWRLPLFNISIPSTPGNYTIEVYFERNGDQMGNNGTQYISNGGSNYKAYIDIQPPTGIISSKVYLKKNSDAEIVYLAGADTDCDPGGSVNFNGLSTGIVTADAYKIGGNFISTLAMTSPKLNYLLYPSGARPSSPVFSEINLSNVSTCSTRFKYEASSATQLFNSNDIVSGTYVLELYFSGVNGGTTYYKRPDPTNNYLSYFTISEPNDGNLNPTGTNISGIFETYMGQLILGLDNAGNPNTADRKISKVFDLDGNYASSNNVNFDLGSTNPGVSFKVGMEAKVFTKGTHKACGCSSWYYLYKDLGASTVDPIESDFPLPSDGSTAVLYSQKWGSASRKFTLMNSSMNWGWNTPFKVLTGTYVSGYGDNSPGYGSSTPDGTYNGQLGASATTTKYKDYGDKDGFSPASTNMIVDPPVNEVACPTCDGTYRIAVAFLCWVQTDSTKKCPGDSGFSTSTDAPTIIYHRDINQNKILNGVYLNPRHPSSPYFTNNKNTLTGTTVFYVSKLDVNASGGDTTYSGSWSSGTPNKGKNTFINFNYSTASGSFTTNNLTIADGVTLTVRSGEYVEVMNTATTTGTGKIVVQKGGNFVQRCNEKIPANGFPYPRIEHTHQTRTIAPYDYVYWSSPIREDIKATLTSAGMGRMFYWQGGAGGGWRNLTTTAADTFGAGKGFIAWNASSSPAAFSPTFIGTATNGEVNVAVTKEDVYPDESDAAALATYNNNYKNFALLGNPYPCAIDAREFLVNANNQHLGGTIYIWTSNSRLSNGSRGVYDAGDYATYTLTGGTAASNTPEWAYGQSSGTTYGNSSSYTDSSNRMIYSGSGFFILVKQNGNAYFSNDMRSITGNSRTDWNWALFKETQKEESKEEESKIWISVRNDDGAYRQMLLGYLPGVTEGYDNYYDGLVSSESRVNIYTKSSNGAPLAIQARPLELMDANETVPVILETKEADDFYITVDMLQGKFKEKDIYLKDKKMGVLHDFSTGKYYFSTESGTYEDRFEIVYKDKPKTVESSDSNEPLKIAVADHVISISKAGRKITKVEFTNILGKRVKEKSYDSFEVVTVNDIIKANQVLIVKVTYEDGSKETKKIIF